MTRHPLHLAEYMLRLSPTDVLAGSEQTRSPRFRGKGPRHSRESLSAIEAVSLLARSATVGVSLTGYLFAR